MANYTRLQAAIDAGTTNMTTVFSGSRIDGGYGTIQTGIDWFKFNGATLESVYIHGNSFLGFNGTSDNFYVNERDASVWEFYTETGTIGHCKFYKMRWVGHAYWSSSYSPTAADRLEWDLFLFDTGQMFLNYYKVPTSYFTNTNGIRADSNVTFSTSSGTACEFTFTPSDTSTGRGWSVGTDRPAVEIYKNAGNAILTLSNYVAGGGDSLFWIADVPEDTSLNLYTKVNSGSWKQVRSNGGVIADLPSGACTLQIKAEMATTDNTVTPKLTGLSIRNSADKKILILTPTMPSDLRGNVGNMSVSYDGLGGLRGVGGPSSAFVGTFTPASMTWRPNPNEEEHIEVSASANVVLTAITYANTQETEHVEVSVAATVTLTDVHDL